MAGIWGMFVERMDEPQGRQGLLLFFGAGQGAYSVQPGLSHSKQGLAQGSMPGDGGGLSDHTLCLVPASSFPCSCWQLGWEQGALGNICPCPQGLG